MNVPPILAPTAKATAATFTTAGTVIAMKAGLATTAALTLTTVFPGLAETAPCAKTLFKLTTVSALKAGLVTIAMLTSTNVLQILAKTEELASKAKSI